MNEKNYANFNEGLLDLIERHQHDFEPHEVIFTGIQMFAQMAFDMAPDEKVARETIKCGIDSAYEKAHAKPEVETHLGLGEYDGQEHVYDGHVTACESGAVEDVISYLTELKDFIPAGEVSLTWEGSNGLWFAGSEALDAIDAELDRITGKAEED